MRQLWGLCAQKRELPPPELLHLMGGENVLIEQQKQKPFIDIISIGA
jgi:hypothetical protein